MHLNKYSYCLVLLLCVATGLAGPLLAQCPPPGFPQTGNACAAAPIICQNLNGYCSTVNNNNIPRAFPGCGGGWILNNDEWLAFFAGSTAISIQITPSNCSSNNNQNGLQGGIYAACGPPWVPLDLQCQCTENPFVLTAGNFVVGQIYYLVLDGCAGDICDYSIQVLSGSTIGVPPNNPGPLNGPATVCQAGSTAYTVAPVVGATVYNWTLNPANAGTISGNGNSITVNWSGNAGGPVELCVTCSNTCFSNPTPACLTINVQPAMTAAQTNTPVTCPGGADGAVTATALGGTPPYSYLWSNGQTTNSADNLVAGTYTVTVTDVNGCSATASASVTQPDTMTITPTITNADCPGATNGAVAVAVTGGTSPYTYLWSNGQTTNSIGNLAAGTYTVTVTDASGCPVTTSAIVANLTILTITPTVTNVKCPGATNGAVAVAVTGGTSPYTYLWSNGLMTDSIGNLATGTYTVTATDANGCSVTTSATIIVQITPADLCPNVCTYCSLNGYTGSTAGYTGQTPPGFCGTIENEQWIGFTAQTEVVTITGTPSNCQFGHGIQIALYTSRNTPAIRCANGISGGGNTPVSIIANLIPGTTYFLLIDGYAGDQCNFNLEMTPDPSEMVQVAPKVFLQGPYIAAVQLMHDSLRVKDLIPLTEPYTGLTNFTHVGGGGETTTADVLAVTGNNAIVDWVFLELRDSANPALVIATRSALLQRDGDVVDVDGVSPVEFPIAGDVFYFVTVRHRNHFGAQVADPAFHPSCNALETDFRNLLPGDSYQFNGLNPAQRLISGKYVLWAGNGRVDFQLKYNGSNNDRSVILSVVGLNTPNATVPGYLLADYNLDGLVKYNGSSNDRNLLLSNVGILTPSAIVHDQIAR
ncbi:MAG: SprB repeat-containing protein [Lewinellaceae bacterium]|nr:SprB repeat-containing protein [Lewinellaceae bacterium]